MAKAPVEQQMKLLELAEIDGKLRGLDVQAKALKEEPRLSDLHQGVTTAKSDLVALETEVGDLTRKMTKAEDDVASVTARIAKNDRALNSGTGLSKDLLALQSEIASLTKRRSDLEDVELEAMDALETATGARDAQLALVAQIQSVLDEVVDETRSRLGGLKLERDASLEERATLAATVQASLIANYERALSKYGVGAARLFHGISGGSGMQLSPGDLAEIRGAAEDEVVYCPDSGAILVRSEDWN